MDPVIICSGAFHHYGLPGQDRSTLLVAIYVYITVKYLRPKYSERCFKSNHDVSRVSDSIVIQIRVSLMVVIK